MSTDEHGRPLLDEASSHRIGDPNAALPEGMFHRLPLPFEAGFLAGRSFLRYRKSGGSRQAPLPDFHIGAHAAVTGMALLTRDAARYRYLKLRVIAPELH